MCVGFQSAVVVVLPSSLRWTLVSMTDIVFSSSSPRVNSVSCSTQTVDNQGVLWFVFGLFVFSCRARTFSVT